MVGYARRIAGPRGVTLLRADLDELPEVAGPGSVDLSFVLLSSIHQLTTPEALERHLRHAATLLAPGGVHVIEATHPDDLTPSGVSRTEWTEVRGDSVVEARFRMHIDRAQDGLVPVTLEVGAAVKNGNGASGNGARAQKTLRQEATWLIPKHAEWQAIAARVPELELVASLGDFHVDVPFEHTAAWRLILVLRRR